MSVRHGSRSWATCPRNCGANWPAPTTWITPISPALTSYARSNRTWRTPRLPEWRWNSAAAPTRTPCVRVATQPSNRHRQLRANGGGGRAGFRQLSRTSRCGVAEAVSTGPPTGSADGRAGGEPAAHGSGPCRGPDRGTRDRHAGCRVRRILVMADTTGQGSPVRQILTSIWRGFAAGDSRRITNGRFTLGEATGAALFLVSSAALRGSEAVTG